jgi:hypothetical protein
MAVNDALADHKFSVIFIEAFQIIVPGGLVGIVFDEHSARLPRFGKSVKPHI